MFKGHYISASRENFADEVMNIVIKDGVESEIFFSIATSKKLREVSYYHEISDKRKGAEFNIIPRKVAHATISTTKEYIPDLKCYAYKVTEYNITYKNGREKIVKMPESDSKLIVIGA